MTVVTRHSLKQYLYLLAPTLGGYAFGYDTGSLSGILTLETFDSFFHNPSNGLQGGITASIQAGAFAGSLLTSWLLADWLGRRRTIILGSIVFTCGIAITCAANNVFSLIAGRVINGMANGCCAMMVPMWQGEVAPKEIRGRIISVQQCVINFGIFSSFLIQYGCSFIDSDASWRLPLGLQMVPTIGLCAIMIFMPESPRWLISKGRFDEALRVLARVHADGDLGSPYVIAEYEEIRASVDYEQSLKQPSYFALLFSKQHSRRTWLGINVQFFQQAVGINSILYYAPFLFQQAGVGGRASLYSNVVQGVVLNVCTWPLMYYLDTWGRRIPTLFGSAGMAVSMLLVGLLLRFQGDPHYDSQTHKVNFNFTAHPDSGRAVLAFLYLYVASFAIGGWSVVAWVVPSDLNTMLGRAKKLGMSTATNWLINFFFALYIPTALDKISWKLYIIFAGICVLSGLSVFLFQPETANRSLEEMSAMFEPDKTMWVFLDRSLTEVHPSHDVIQEKIQDIVEAKQGIVHEEDVQV